MSLRSVRNQSKLQSSAILALMILAFALKTLIPAGFMPETQNGLTKLVICSGLGEKTIFVPSNDQPTKDHEKESSGQICTYQTITSHKILLAPDVILIPLPMDVFVENDASPEIILTAQFYSSFTARAPPASV